MASVSRAASESLPHPDDVRAYVDYLRDLGIYDLIAQQHSDSVPDAIAKWAQTNLRAQRSESEVNSAAPRRSAERGPAATPIRADTDQARPHRASAATPPQRPPALSPFDQAQQRRSGSAAHPTVRQNTGPSIHITPQVRSTQAAPQQAIPPAEAQSTAPDFFQNMPAPTPFNQLAPLPAARVAPAEKPAALAALRNLIGDCTRCPLAYAGRHSIVFADGDPNARLMFVGEGPGADEDVQGLPFVGKAGQLLNNMIGAMGLRREQVFIANIVKCRPPKNRVPEPVEANTCSPFLLQQIDIVQPEVIVALGSTAATYLLGVKQSLTSLRGRWFEVRGSKCAVTYHPAFLLRDPRQKGEAWKDLQRVMTELKLKAPERA